MASQIDASSICGVQVSMLGLHVISPAQLRSLSVCPVVVSTIATGAAYPLYTVAGTCRVRKWTVSAWRQLLQS